MPLLEIVRTDKTSPQTIVDLLEVGKNIKKTPIVVGNCTGFAVNRMFFPYSQSALLLVDRGMDVYRIDRACTKFGMPMGPFRCIFFSCYCYFRCLLVFAWGWCGFSHMHSCTHSDIYKISIHETNLKYILYKTYS
jgi:3-hydroxyacyl-CoA dehydrogenase, C-terminal domain/3-hydroxyacyl-CoA dehydrogenase, NAD binding domain